MRLFSYAIDFRFLEHEIFLFIQSNLLDDSCHLSIVHVTMTDKTWGKGAAAGELAAGQSNKYICITRPRRFGKTIAANMISAYFGKKCDSSSVFDGLKISNSERYRDHPNQYNVIHITFSEMPRDC